MHRSSLGLAATARVRAREATHMAYLHDLCMVCHLLARETRTAQRSVRTNATEKAPVDTDTNKKAIPVELALAVSWTQ